MRICGRVFGTMAFPQVDASNSAANVRAHI